MPKENFLSGQDFEVQALFDEVKGERGKMAQKRKSEHCSKAGCKGWAMHDGSGFCSGHNPAREELRRQQLQIMLIKSHIKGKETGGTCAFEGCRGWAMRDGSGLCRVHNPNLAEKNLRTGWKISKTKRIKHPPPDRKCTVKLCKCWAMLDGSGLCWWHKPETISRRGAWLNKGKKFEKGHHNPWLGLSNIKEARGLLFYSLESDKPLLTLRALTKIMSLRAQGIFEWGKRGE